MKRILITGANSYVGTHVEKWLMKEPDKYAVDTLDMQNSIWREYDFLGYDVVYHVAGIAHVSTKKSMEDLYYRINRDLTIETAMKAKKSGVKHFIFMSSMIVYNSKETIISKTTQPNPDNFYGLSKLLAEKGINQLEDDNFRITILRPPLIYGPNSKGNFPKLLNFARKTFIFPKYPNTRSVLYIDNLSNIIKHVIDDSIFGLLFPQNNEYMCTYKVLEQMSKLFERKVYFSKIFNFFINFTKNRFSVINKLFSDSYYETNMSSITKNYSVVTLEESLKHIVMEIEKNG